ncbi:hypothetical protein K469DRAFT_697362 [Zopfia rhizophila CBS 207.26]|uniref:Uncharacterized protein n=1 Tax=Zopfia rhizophila CBS 207.26 TaxID=1314779 RepID=A0A6A6DFW8_9PEZI|nr:hypothetical protein K469DRAFT_697362 [Zopfia rhizophila CBS 207.26]
MGRRGPYQIGSEYTAIRFGNADTAVEQIHRTLLHILGKGLETELHQVARAFQSCFEPRWGNVKAVFIANATSLQRMIRLLPWLTKRVEAVLSAPINTLMTLHMREEVVNQSCNQAGSFVIHILAAEYGAGDEEELQLVSYLSHFIFWLM